MSKSFGIEKARESLRKLSDNLKKEIDELTLFERRNTEIQESYTHKKSSETQTSADYEPVSKYQEKISELETEIRALSLYVTKIVSRVAGNPNLQSALFFDTHDLDLSPPSPADSGEDPKTPEDNNSPNSVKTITVYKESPVDSKKILKGTTDWIRGLAMFNPQSNTS